MTRGLLGVFLILLAGCAPRYVCVGAKTQDDEPVIVCKPLR